MQYLLSSVYFTASYFQSSVDSYRRQINNAGSVDSASMH